MNSRREVRALALEVPAFAAAGFRPARVALVVLLLTTASALAGTPGWLDLVNPILTSSERKTYLSLLPAEQDRFEKEFWTGKTISSEEYFQRVQYVDTAFGSGKPGSGANTDQGRVYLSLGPPTKVTHLPSSRIFVPIEIWYYDVVPGVLQTELRLLFYQKNSLGFPKLYSPNVDTIRALLLPQAGTVHMFGPNDTLDEAAIRKNLNVAPAEDEVITAAVGVASGIKDIGNDEILGRVTSPRTMLTRDLKETVRSRLVGPVPKLTTILTRSPYGGAQADLSFELTARGKVKLEVFQGEAVVDQSTVELRLDAPQAIQYLHRLDLLPGSYRLRLSVNDNTFPYALEVPAQLAVGTLLRASEAQRERESATPFEFDKRSFYPSENGDFVLWQVPQPGAVDWSIRRGLEVVWKSRTQAGDIAFLPLPFRSLPAGSYRLEASSGNATQYLDFENAKTVSASAGTLVSYNANLAPAMRYTAIGEQRVLRGQLNEARVLFEKSLAIAPLERTQIGLARVEALSGKWDEARDRLRPILASEPRNFDALCVLAYVEAQLQDWEVAAGLYRRALEVQDSAVVRKALAQLQH